MMNASTKITKATSIVIFAGVLASGVGCTKMTNWKPSKMFSLDSTWPFKDKDAPHEGVPVRMVCTWTDTVLTQAGKKPQRGFGGRVMFYGKEEKKPILVDGQLVVYAFDETGREPTDNKPTRRYVFPPEQIPLHMSKSELGSSYSFWLPWDEVGGPRTEVSLICRFEPKGGAVVSSEQAKQSLPGREPVLAGDGTKHPPKLPDGVPSKPAIQTLQSLQAQRRETHDARQASYEVPVANDPQALAIEAAQNNSLLPAKRMTATTINLPNNFQMPSAAAIRDRNVPAVNHAPLTAASYSQPLLSQSALQQTPVTRQLGQNIAGAGGRPNLSPINLPSQIPQAPASALNTMTPTMKPSIQSPGGISTTPISMSPQQPPANQAALQQMLQQQQALQQKIIQLEAQSPTGMPSQVGNTATVSYPTGGQYQR